MCIARSVGQGGQNDHSDVKTIQILLNLAAKAIGLATTLAEDGVLGASTLDAIKKFQSRVLEMSSPDGRVDPDSAAVLRLRVFLAGATSTVKLKGTLINAPEANLALYATALSTRMHDREITGSLREAHFLAQIGHESGELRYAEELASGEAYEGRKDLGNTEPGDGPRFKGRGLIQLTGRTNYLKYGQAIGKDLVTNDHWKLVAEEPELAVDVACWYWDTHHLNQSADEDDITTITRRINGGLNGLDSRKALLTRAKFFLPSGI